MSQTPRFFYWVWMVNESFKQTLWGEHLPVALFRLSRACHKYRNEQHTVISELCPLFCPLLLLSHWLWERTSCLQLVCRQPVGAISAVFVTWCFQHFILFTAIHTCSVTLPPLLSWSWASALTVSPLKDSLCLSQAISVVLGWEAWWVSQDLLRRMGNDFLINFLLCMLIAMLLKITLF